MMIMNRNQGFQTPWYLQPAFAPVRPQNIVLWVNSSSWDGMVWRNLAPSYSDRNHGTLKNGVGIGELIHPSGIFGASLKFDGTDDYVDCGNDVSLNIQNAITIEAWVKMIDCSANTFIISKWNNVEEDNVFYLFCEAAETLRFKVYNESNNSAYVVSNTLNKNQWYYVVGIYDGSYVKLYVNGILQGSPSPLTGEIRKSTEELYIGYKTDWVSGRYFNGLIDEVRIYNRALSASDVFHNYTHSPIYYMQQSIDPMSLLQQPAWQVARSVA